MNRAQNLLASLPRSGRQRLEVLQQVAAATAGSGDAAAMLEVARRCLAEAEQALEQMRDERDRIRTERSAARHELTEARALQARLEQLDEQRRTRAVLPDIGADLRPDPLESRTPAELIAALRRFRQWAGNPSFRAMWRRSGRRAGVSTMCTVLGGDTLPDRLEVIDAIVEGCGGIEEDRRRFATAWRELAMGSRQAQVVQPFRQAYKTAAR